jgi:hypothetical protein
VLVFKAHRLVYHSTLGWRVIKEKKKEENSRRWRKCSSDLSFEWRRCGTAASERRGNTLKRFKVVETDARGPEPAQVPLLLLLITIERRVDRYKSL